MIESAAYDLIKQEGIQEGIQEGLLRKSREAVLEALEARFDVVPRSISTAIDSIADSAILKTLHRKAITVESLDHFRQAMDDTLR